MPEDPRDHIDDDVAGKKADGRGRHAERPLELPAKGWKDVVWRVWRQTVEDRASLIAAGTAFYLLLALFPALAAFVSIYGFVADPDTVVAQTRYLEGLVPESGLDLIREQLDTLVSQDTGTLSFGLLVALAAGFWSAGNGVKTVFEALNIAYEEREKRSFIRLNLVAFAFTLGAIVVAGFMLLAVGIVPAVMAFLPVSGVSETLISLVRWPLLMAVVFASISIVYRYGPSRERAQWRWITWGGALATIVWVAASAGFSYYLQNFADYGATYGSLGAVVGMMLWIWISALILIIGAELDAEMEHQTAVDTTTGEPQPMGERGAVVADTLGESSK